VKYSFTALAKVYLTYVQLLACALKPRGVADEGNKRQGEADRRQQQLQAMLPQEMLLLQCMELLAMLSLSTVLALVQILPWRPWLETFPVSLGRTIPSLLRFRSQHSLARARLMEVSISHHIAKIKHSSLSYIILIHFCFIRLLR
jgi:hypothetical protein